MWIAAIVYYFRVLELFPRSMFVESAFMSLDLLCGDFFVFCGGVGGGGWKLHV